MVNKFLKKNGKKKMNTNNFKEKSLSKTLSQEEKQLLLSLIRREQRDLKDEMELWDHYRSSVKGRGVCPTMFRNPHNPPDAKYIENLDKLEFLFSSTDVSVEYDPAKENQILKQIIKDLVDRIQEVSDIIE